MSEENTKKAEGQTSSLEKHIAINGQYVKDLSFENPKSPESLIGQSEQPHIDISVDINAKKINESVFEVSLTITANAKVQDDPLFIADLTYAGLFTLTGIDDAEREGVLMVYCPSLIFPYARRIISDATRDGGFPPLMMDPIDFARLYHQRQQGSQSSEAEADDDSA